MIRAASGCRVGLPPGLGLLKQQILARARLGCDHRHHGDRKRSLAARPARLLVKRGCKWGHHIPVETITTVIQRSRRNLGYIVGFPNKKKPRGAYTQGFSLLVTRTEPEVHRGDGAWVRVPSSLHQQSNKALLAPWFEPQRCKSRNAHLRDFFWNSSSTSSLTN